MKVMLVFLMPLLVLLNCIHRTSHADTSGITGEVRWVEGNLMPGIGDTSYVSRSKGEPIEREIFIYAATKNAEALQEGGNLYTRIESALVAKVKSKKDGTFKAILPPGRYSVFVREEGGFFANMYDGENYINPVTVQANKFTEIKILVNYKAYY